LVGKSVPHASAHKHASGEAEFLDDVPKCENELALAFILSERAHARILRIDTSRSRAVDGVVGFVFHDDLKTPDKNWFGLILQDEEIFASKEVLQLTCQLAMQFNDVNRWCSSIPGI
jgi:xanthine dehydrogenase/oxidase